MNNYLLYSLLGEYARQFQEAAEAVREKLDAEGFVTKDKVRVWNANVTNTYGLQPTADDDAELWHWETVVDIPICLSQLEQTLFRFAAFVEGLEG